MTVLKTLLEGKGSGDDTIESGKRMTNASYTYEVSHLGVGLILQDSGESRAAFLLSGHALKK